MGVASDAHKHGRTLILFADAPNVGSGPFPVYWLEDFTFLTMSVEKMPWRNWKGLKS
jgi:hypothetical protein